MLSRAQIADICLRVKTENETIDLSFMKKWLLVQDASFVVIN